MQNIYENEIWKAVDGYDGYYFISNYGRVYSSKNEFTRKEKLRKATLTQRGYHSYALVNPITKQITACFSHRLVAQAFIPNPDNKPQVNHRDGNKINNYVDNLEWNTPRENYDHAVANNLTPCGEKNFNAKLTEREVLFIYSCLKAGVRIQPLMDKFNVCFSTINDIKRAGFWKYLKLEPIYGKFPFATVEKIELIEELLKTNNITRVRKLTHYNEVFIKKVKTQEYEQLKQKLKELSTFERG